MADFTYIYPLLSRNPYYFNMMQNQPSTAFADTKPHYELLDGLRGVAALLVIWYHIFEGYAFAGGGVITTVNHGYLAVDFFFMLSGFVISYAYDDRWGKQLTLGGFLRRRLVRLHPMVMMGAVIGVIAYLFQGGVQWDGTPKPYSAVMLALLLGMFLLPIVPGAAVDVRGNGEMFPLNGPSWSLFFEYIGNIVYALVIRRLSNVALVVWTLLLGLLFVGYIVVDPTGYGNIGVGWTLDIANFTGGLLRMLFPFSLGMVLARHFRPVKVKGAFWICSLVLVVLFHVPYLEAVSGIPLNGVFEFACIALVFPVLLWIGASGTTTDTFSTRTCKFLGEISFPVYIVHYPLMYLFYSWLIERKLYSLDATWQVALAVMAGSVVLAYVCLKCYDEPVRKWLGKRCL